MNDATAVLLAARDNLFGIAEELLTTNHAASLAVEFAAITVENLVTVDCVDCAVTAPTA